MRPEETAVSDSSRPCSCCCCGVALGWWRPSDRPVASSVITLLALLACPRESPSLALLLSALLCYQVHPQRGELIVGFREWGDKSPLSSTLSPGPRVPLASGCFRICFLLVHQALHDEGQQGPIHSSPPAYFTAHCSVHFVGSDQQHICCVSSNIHINNTNSFKCIMSACKPQPDLLTVLLNYTHFTFTHILLESGGVAKETLLISSSSMLSIFSHSFIVLCRSQKLPAKTVSFQNIHQGTNLVLFLMPSKL